MIINTNFSPIYTFRNFETGTNVEPEKSANVANNIQEVDEKQEKKQTNAEIKPGASSSKDEYGAELSQQELKQLKELRQRDQEVRTHEQAHAAAAGSLTRGLPSYSFQRGPDGQLYAIGGEVQIDTSPVPGDPEATVEKAQKIRRAALAPAQPSQQDRSIAAAMAAMEAQARIEIAREKLQETTATDTLQQGDNKINNSEMTNLSETKTTCSQCGGQHSAESHTVAVNIAQTFNNVEDDGSEKTINIAI